MRSTPNLMTLSEPTLAEQEQAIQFLARSIAPEVLANVRLLMQNKQNPWHHANHFGLGLHIRNLLREAGLKWTDVWLDDHWNELVESAAIRSKQENR